jgi:hypothetical protein
MGSIFKPIKRDTAVDALAEDTDKDADKSMVVDILCYLPPDRKEWIASGYMKYVLPLEEAKRKISQLLDRLAKGEIESISISPTVFGFPRAWEKKRT